MLGTAWDMGMAPAEYANQEQKHIRAVSSHNLEINLRQRAAQLALVEFKDQKCGALSMGLVVLQLLHEEKRTLARFPNPRSWIRAIISEYSSSGSPVHNSAMMHPRENVSIDADTWAPDLARATAVEPLKNLSGAMQHLLLLEVSKKYVKSAVCSRLRYTGLYGARSVSSSQFQDVRSTFSGLRSPWRTPQA